MSYFQYKDNKNNYIKIKNIFTCTSTSARGGKAHNNLILIDENKLLNQIKKNTKPSYQAIYGDDDKLENNIANFGLNPGEIAVRYGNEYNGFSIRAIEEIKPILTG